jgi:polyferredoxin
MNPTGKKNEQCFCPSFYDDNNVLQDCICGKCGKEMMISELYFGYLLSLIRESKTIEEVEQKAIEWWNNEDRNAEK